jgi:acyl carrier protein
MIRILVVAKDQPRAGRDALRLAAAAAGLQIPSRGTTPRTPRGMPDGPASVSDMSQRGRWRFPHPRASVTHTERAGAAAVLVSGPASGVGVDLEHDRPVSPAMTRFYLRDDEPPGDPLRLWTVKEAMFKADPGNATRLLRDYRVSDPAYQHTSVRYRGGWLSVAARTRRGSVPTSVITFDAVADRIASVLRVPVTMLTPQTTMKDLAADSFMLVEMVVDLQEEFDAMFTQARLREVANLGDLVALLQETAA